MTENDPSTNDPELEAFFKVLSDIAELNKDKSIEVSPESKKEEKGGENEMEHQKAINEGRMVKTKADGYEDRRNDRKLFTSLLFQFVCMWLIFVGLLVLWSGMGKLKYSDTILVTILTTTTSGVLLYFHSVLKYLFGDKE